MNFQSKEDFDICAVLLAANTDFGRCRLASKIPPALWPTPTEPAISNVLKKLVRMSIKKTVICCNGNKSIFQTAVDIPDSMEVIFLDEKLPYGTAGCIRETATACPKNIFLIVPSQIISLPDLSDSIIQHINNEAYLTILCGQNLNANTSANIYIANKEITKYIPSKGYFDIKENLIPSLVRENKKVIFQTLKENLYTFRNHSQYLDSMSAFLLNMGDISQKKLISENIQLDKNIKILAPALIANNSIINENAVIIGPAFIGENVNIGKNSLIERSFIWDDTLVSQNCFISNSIIDYNSSIPSFSRIENKIITNKRIAKIEYNLISSFKVFSEKIKSQQNLRKLKAASFLILVFIFIWTYFPEIKDLSGVWGRNSDYSAGLLVPFLTIIALWLRKVTIFPNTIKSIIFGIIFFIFAQIIRLFGLYFMYSAAERLSVVLSIWAIVIVLFGWKSFYKNIAPLLFLILMLPPPHIVHNLIMIPLQNMATWCAVFCVSLLGYAANHQGNILYVDNTAISISEACSGLRMITAFVIIVVFTSLIIRKSVWQKLSLMLSSLPIAFACNIFRLTVTAVVFTTFWGRKWAEPIHDFSGYAMVPLGLVMLLLEIKMLNIFVSKT